MSWTLEEAEQCACDMGEMMCLAAWYIPAFTVSVKGALWHVATNGVALVGAQASETAEMKAGDSEHAGAATQLLEQALDAPCHGYDAEALRRWMSGGGYGRLDGLSVDRRVLEPVTWKLARFTVEAGAARIGRHPVADAIVLGRGDALAIVMGISPLTPIPATEFSTTGAGGAGVIVRVYLKEPDGFCDSVDEAVRDEVAKLGLPEDEAEAVFDARRKKVWDALAKWVEYQDCVTIAFDTDHVTAVVEAVRR